MLPAWLAVLLAAPFVGSFLGVLVVRLPEGRPVAVARSACDGCGAPLGVRDLVPLLTYVAARGRCRRCGVPIGRFAPAIELAALLAAALAVAAWTLRADPAAPSPAWLWSGCVLGWGMLALGCIDWRCFRLPDPLTLPLLLLGLADCAWLQPGRLGSHAAGAVAGYAGFRLVALLYRRLRGRDGLGAGDAKLLAAGGAWLGIGALPTLVLLAALATLAMALVRSRGRLRADLAVPFGPGLAAATYGLWLVAAPLPATPALLLG